ncbi:unnamed protein product [Ascophyllum nodosum]
MLSKTLEVDMDVNNVVMHTRPGSTALGVTPSDPTAILSLFHEVSTATSRVPDESETGSTTEEGEESGEHVLPPPPGAAVQTASAARLPSYNSAVSAPAAGSEKFVALACGYSEPSGRQTRIHRTASAASKIWSQSKGSVASTSSFPSSSQQPSQPPPSKNDSGNVFWGRPEERATLGASETRKTRKTPMRDRFFPALGRVQPTEDSGRLRLTSTAEEEPQQTKASPQEPSAQKGAPHPPKQGSGFVVPEPPLINLASVNEGDVSLTEAPLRRKSSMGSFQRGMGESLTGRLRKQLDIPEEPKSEVNLNIPLDQIEGLEYLAQGAMCVAYTALFNGETVVLKTPLPDAKHADVAANDLEVEMLLLKELHHDNIVSLQGAGFLPDGRRFVALEYLSGGTLSSLLRNQGSKPLSLSKVLDLSLALCNALEYLHDCAVPGRIVCHRDLKPDNIGLMEDGTLKLIDFGLGKIIKRRFRVRAEKYHMTGGTGSLRYMAPEIADHHEYNEKGDVYSFSLIMWEMLAGEKPFLGLKRPDFYSRVVDKGERPPLNPEWPEQIRDLLESCWRTDLDERLSFREVGGILKVCAEEENRRRFTMDKCRICKLWNGSAAKPDVNDIALDPKYKPKYTISTFFAPTSELSEPGLKEDRGQAPPTRLPHRTPHHVVRSVPDLRRQ